MDLPFFLPITLCYITIVAKSCEKLCGPRLFPSTIIKDIFKAKNTRLILIFLGHSQFGPYILVAINLVLVIFNVELI